MVLVLFIRLVCFSCLTVLLTRRLHNANSKIQFRKASEHQWYAATALRDHRSPAELTPVKSVVMDNIRGKTIVITGAARGIGHATAKALLARGARVVIGDRDVDMLESAVAGMSSLGAVSGHPLDVTDRESFAAFLDKARADGSEGHVDVLINNAGVMPVG